MKNSIQKIIGSVIILVVTIIISSFSLTQVVKKRDIKPPTLGFAVLELFTSQGCSSCPPADAVLAKYALQNNPNIVPLAFHVDYWDRLGWKDPFSKPEFSERQRQYVDLWNLQNSYTPQLVINGKYELVGSKENAIQNLVNQELAIKNLFNIKIKQSSLKANQLNVIFDVDESNQNTFCNLALVKKKESTRIKRGENRGLELTNYNIVYDFKTVSSASNKASFEFSEKWLPSDFFVVAYLQNSKTGKILIASKSEIK